jgi:omega-amidase
MMAFHLVQAAPAWESPAANRQLFDELLDEARDEISGGVVILPEMFSTGFSMGSARLAEPMDGPTVKWMVSRASQGGYTLCGSIIITDHGNYYNRFLWVTPGGHIKAYDKRHLFRMAAEDAHYSPGTEQVLIGLSDFSVCPQICYDLRFPVWSRNSAGFDVLVYVANWPAVRREQWLTLLKARAIENLCYVIGVNRTGTDGNGVNYSGDSCVINHVGEVVLDLGSSDTIQSQLIDTEAMVDYRKNFPAHLDADRFQFPD